jgi:hypothetical protein
LFTGFTLGAGFKGGEVTLLFFYWSHIRKRLLLCHCLLRFWQEWDL